MEISAAVKFDNFLLKGWLHRIGRRRRYEILRKLKHDLEDRGLEKSQVKRGLLQLATKPCILLRRLPENYSLKKSPPEENASSSCHTKSECKSRIPFFEKHFHHKSTNGQRSGSSSRVQPETESSTERCDKQVERPKNRKISKRLFVEDDKPLLQDKANTKNRIEMNSHPFDSALSKLDKMFIPRRENNSDKKWTSPAGSEMKNLLAKTDVNGGVSCPLELTADNFGTESIPVRVKLNQIKLNFNKNTPCKESMSSCNKKSSTKDYVNVCTDKTERNVERKRSTSSSEKISLKRKSDKTNEAKEKYLLVESLKSSDCKSVNDKESSHRKRSYQPVKQDHIQKRKYTSISDLEEMYVKKRKKVARKYRKYFGEILTVSEDEKEQRTLRNKFRKRRKKDSVDSCDSGVFLSEENVPLRSNMEVVREIETVMPDSTMQEDNEEAVDDISTIVSNEEDKTVSEIESAVLSITEDIAIKSAMSTCEADSSKNAAQEITQIETADSCSEDNFLGRQKSIDTSEMNKDTTKTQVITTSVAETDVLDIEAIFVSIKKACNVEANEETVLNTIEHDRDIVSNKDKDTKDAEDSKEALLELLRMNITETCTVIGDGNVISLQENDKVDNNQNIINTDTDEIISSLKEEKKDDLNSSHNTNDEERVESSEVTHLTPKDEPKDEQNTENTYSESLIVAENTQKVIDVITLDTDISNILNDDQEKPTENAQATSVIEENRVEQPNVVHQPRLRVLSSAELGSRWCPTPVCSTSNDTAATATISYIPTTVNAFSGKPFAFTVSVTLTSDAPSKSTTSPISTLTSPVQTVPSVVSTAQKQSISAQFPVTDVNADINNDYNNIIRTVLQKICRLVKNNRFLFSKCSAAAAVSKEDNELYKKSTVVLLAYIEKLGMMTHTTDYNAVVNQVTKALNAKLLATEPLTFQELAAYAPQYQSMYYTKLCNAARNNNISYSTPSGYSNKPYINNSRQIYTTPVSQPIPATNNVLSQNTQVNVFPAPAAGNQMPTNALRVRSNVGFPTSNRPNEKYQQKRQTSFQKNQQKRKASTMSSLNSNTSRMGYGIQTPQATSSKETLHVHPVPNQVMTQNIPPPQRLVQQHIQATPVLQQSVQGVTCSPATNVVPNAYVQEGLYTQQTHTYPRNYANKSVPSQPIQQTINTPYVSTLHSTSLPAQSQQAQFVTHQQTVRDRSQELNAGQLQSSSSLLQNVQQGIPVILVSHNISQPTSINYVPQAAHFSSHLPQCVPTNMPQKENIPQPMPFTISQNIVSGDTISQDYTSQSTHCSTNKPQNVLPVQKQGISFQVPVDVGKTEQKGYHILKNFTTIQKRTLVNQILYYFTLTKRLQRYFTRKQWNDILSTKLSLYQLQTALSSSLQKTTGQCESPKTCETEPKKNMSVHIKDVPEIVQNAVQQQETTSTQEVLKETVAPKQPSEIPHIEEKRSEPENHQCDKPREENSQSTATLEQTEAINIKQEEENVQDKEIEETLNDSRVPDNIATAEVQQASLQDLKVSSESSSVQQEEEEMPLAHKEIENASSVTEDTSLQAADLEKQGEITVGHQPNLHVVTVEVCPNNDEVKVVDAKVIVENTDNVIDNIDESKTDECNQKVLSGQVEHSIVSSPLSMEDPNISTVVEVSDPNVDDSMEETISYITDVRSIPLNVFEEMGNTDNADTDKMDTDVEEEESKICLNCSKTSTVLCEVCLDAHYCSKTCSESHWKEHYKNCKPHQLYTEYKCDFSSLQHVLHSSVSSS